MSDIRFEKSDGKFLAIPQTAVGLYWLQSHFNDRDSRTIAEGRLLVSQRCAYKMVKDASCAEIDVDFS